MPSKRRLLTIGLFVVLAALLVFGLGPAGVSRGVRWWLAWQAHQQELKIEVGAIDAPLFQPIVIHNLHVSSQPSSPCAIELTADRAVVGLQLARILTGASGRAIRALKIDNLRIETSCHAANEKKKSNLAWPVLQTLLPQNFNIGKLDLRVENDATTLLLRNASLAGGQVETGRFSAAEFTISSPWFRQTFSGLHSALDWHDNRLTLGEFSLTRGLGAQAIAIDLADLANRHLGMELDFNAFGGKLRANISSDWRGQPSAWNMAGSASEVSLEQTSEAFGFTNRIGGRVHACKFTFRGNTHDLARATASVWLELSNSSWMGRSSDVIMLGAAIYDRQIQLQQLYVKQRNNQLTLSGEGALPSNSSGWLSPDFRGDISASIHDLGDFAGLFGARTGDFAGSIAMEGTVNARERTIGGHLAANGASLTLFQTAIDALTARLSLKGSQLEVEQLELKRKADVFVAHGRIDMSREHNYSGDLSISVKNVSDYMAILRGPAATDVKPAPAELQATIDSGKWDLRGTLTPAGSSPIRLSANFPLPVGGDWTSFAAAPVNATLDFPALLLAGAPQFFHPDIFREGIVSGKLSLSGTLKNPAVTGDIQLLNARLQNAPMDLLEASGRIAFHGGTASVEFLNAGTRDVDLAFRGDINLSDTTDVAIRLTAAIPLFDVANRTNDCASRIEFAPVNLGLAPVITELESRGGLFQGDWSLITRENESSRKIRLCLEANATEKTLMMGAPARPSPTPSRTPKKKRR